MVDVAIMLVIWLKNKHIEIFSRSLKPFMYKCIPAKIQKCNNLFFSTFSINILWNSLYLIFASDGKPNLITAKNYVEIWLNNNIKIFPFRSEPSFCFV